MNKYLVCSLDDESYYHPYYTFCDSLDEAKKRCEIDAEFFADFADDCNYKMVFEERKDGSYRYDIKNEYEGFYVNHILPVDMSKGRYLLVNHHAYNGVDFCICYQSDSLEDMQNELKKQSESLCKEYNGFDYFCNTYESGFDDGYEWHYYRIVED